MQAQSQRVLIALATYNERDNLAALTEAIRAAAPDADLLILDDHSPDGTGELADDLARRDGRIGVIHRAGKLGLGTAILTIMRHAIEGDYDLLVTMDADFSHHPRYLADLLRQIEHADVAIGSRYVPGGGVENWPLSRRLMSRATNRLVRFLLGMPVRDASGNYRCYRVALLKRVNFDNLLSQGYSFLQEILHRCHLAGARFAETPIVFTDRRVGASKANWKEMAGSLSALVRLGWRARFHKAAMTPTRDAAAPARKAA